MKQTIKQAILDSLCIYDGFVPSNGKKPKEKLKDRDEIYSFDDVEALNGFVGVLKENIISVDVDDPEQAEILYKIVEAEGINCIVRKTTRGLHFYFINPLDGTNKQHTYTAIGIVVDFIKGNGKTKAEPVKIDGKYRDVLMSCSIDELDPLPTWLYPIGKNDPGLLGLQDGEGRNPALYNHILPLQSAGLSQEEIKKALEIINQHIFKEPVLERELETIYRDDAFKKISFMDGKKFKPMKMAEYLQRQYYISIIHDNLSIYKGGVYLTERNNRAIHQVMNKEYIDIKKNEAIEVIYKLEVTSPVKEVSKEPKIIFSNGIYNVDTKLMEPHSPDYVSLNKIPWSYNPNSYDEELDKALNDITCNDKNIRAVIEELFGACLYSNIDNRFNRIFMFTGSNILDNGSNGKSTILELLYNVLGKDNTSNLSLEDLTKQFKPIQLKNKLANIGDDIDKRDIDSTGLLKKLVTGEGFNAEAKGKDGVDIKNYANLIFSANTVPKINDFTYGMKRRLMFIPFEAVFTSGKNENKDIKFKAENGDRSYIEYMIKLAIDGLYRLLNNGGYTKSHKVDKIMKNFEEYNNPVLSFLNTEYQTDDGNYDELLYKDDNDYSNNTKDVFLRFSAWCIENNIKNKLEQKQFTEQVNNITGFSKKQVKPTIKGKRVSKYIWYKK